MTQIRNLIDENGKRIDGRGADELRTVKITVGAVKNADGSAFIEFGKNKILAAVYGPREVPTDACFAAVITWSPSPRTRARTLPLQEGKSRSLR